MYGMSLQHAAAAAVAEEADKVDEEVAELDKQELVNVEQEEEHKEDQQDKEQQQAVSAILLQTQSKYRTHYMPLVVICGQPCSGKSTFARALSAHFQQQQQSDSNGQSETTSHSNHHRAPVHVVDEPSLHLERNAAYKDVVREKNTRGLLRSALDRTLSKDTTVIFDSLNNIKGYRYELWCIARAAGTRYCTVHCDATIDTARAWNEDRASRGEPSYSSEIFEDLASRFETPDSKNRWDAPLFTINTSEGKANTLLLLVNYCCTDCTDSYVTTITHIRRCVIGSLPHFLLCCVGYDGGRQQPLLDAIVSVIRGKEDPSTARGARNLQPTVATQTVRLSDTNLLYQLDKATQEVITTLIDAQSAAGGQPAGSVRINPHAVVTLHRTVSLPELRRLKRTFVKMATQTTAAVTKDAESVKRMFVEYVQRELDAQ
eukprot:jgi/Chlat1/7209/Chrsp57S06758